MNKTPFVSIIMPTYSRADLLPRSIESVLNQTYGNFEFIIVNDCSADKTEEIVLKYQKKDPRIKYFKNEVNLKIQKTLNRGLKEAKGKYIARIDDDDAWIDPAKLRKQVEFLESNPEYVIVGTGNTAILKSRGLQISSLKPRTDMEIRKAMLFGCPFLHPAVVYRRSAVLLVGGYDEKLKQAEDYDLWMRLGKIGKMYNLPEYSIESIVGDTNIGHLKRAEVIKFSLALIRKYRRDYPFFFRAYIKNYLEYLDALWPFLRKIFFPAYKLRRFFLDKFRRKTKISKMKL
ncbi:MAG: glycosyltransferase family 2 protein [Patescibacteria group bacterium]